MSAPVELSAEELSAIRAWVANVAGHGGSLTSADWLTIGRLGGHKAQFLPEVLMAHIDAREAAHAAMVARQDATLHAQNRLLSEGAVQLARREAEAKRLHQLLYALTPGGWEFVGEPERCAEWVRERLALAESDGGDGEGRQTFEEWWDDLSPDFDVDPDYPLTDDHKDMARAGWDARDAEVEEARGDLIWEMRVRAALHQLDECQHDGWCDHRRAARAILAGNRDPDLRATRSAKEGADA